MYNKLDKKKAEEKKLNAKVSHLVNKVFALAIICEGLSLDCMVEEVTEPSARMRSYVNIRGVAEQFGDWADTLEQKILQLSIEKFDILVCCCTLIHIYSKQMEQVYRSYDPLFDFYERESVKELYQWASRQRLNKDLFDKINSLLKAEI